MTDIPAPNDANVIEPPFQRFDSVAISFHWLTLLLIIGMFSTAWLRDWIGHSPEARLSPESQLLLGLHRSLGVTIWVVTVGRLAWRLTIAKLPPFPPRMSRVRQQVAKAVEYGLYLLLLIQPLTGLAQTLFRGRPYMLLFFEVPAIVPEDAAIAKLFHQIHEAGAIALLSLIGVHALIVLFYQYILKHEMLQRMLPSRRR